VSGPISKSGQNQKKFSRSVISWVLYDWANSAFALSILTGFFPMFFQKYWSVDVSAAVTTARLGAGNAIAGIAIAVLSPLLGAFADAGRKRKSFLVFCMSLGAIFTAILALIGQGSWEWALVIFVGANIGFSCANLFYDSLLPVVVTKEKFDVVSSTGYAFGYLGCALLFAINIVFVNTLSWPGFAPKVFGVKVSFVSVSVWWFVFSIPLMLWVKESVKQNIPSSIRTTIYDSLGRLKNTALDIKDSPRLLFFLIAYWLYIDGVHTFIRMASNFGLSLGLESQSLMAALLVVQLVAFPFAYVFGLLAKRTSAFVSLIIGISLYVGITITGPFILKNELHFFIFAALTAVPLGCLQALSRSWFAHYVPEERSAEFFGFYSLMGKFAVFFGPAMVGGLTLLLSQLGVDESLAVRCGMASLVVLFLSGGILLVIAQNSPMKKIEKKPGY